MEPLLDGELEGADCSLLAHAADIDDLLEGLDGVLKNGLDGLHDTEAALHIVDLGLHALDGLHLAGDLFKTSTRGWPSSSLFRMRAVLRRWLVGRGPAESTMSRGDRRGVEAARA